MLIRRHYTIFVSGKVQGVSYRFNAQAKAHQFDLTGFVKNLATGQVYIEVEGMEPNINKFIEWCYVGPRLAKVSEVKAEESESVVGDPLSPSPEISEARARQDLEGGVAAILTDFPAHPAVELLVVPGDPRAGLRAASSDADLLVVGSRGHGALDHLLLGSVATALAHHPTVPTIVVPHHGDDSF